MEFRITGGCYRGRVIRMSRERVDRLNAIVDAQAQRTVDAAAKRHAAEAERGNAQPYPGQR